MIKINEGSYAGLIRQELDGTYLCIPAEVGKPIFFNNTIYEIFSLCNNSSISNVVNEMQKKYPDIDGKRILQGVLNTVWYLNNIGILTIENERDENLIMNSSTEVLSMPDEKDFKKISEYIMEKYGSLISTKFFYVDANINRDKKAVIREIYKTVNIRLEQANGHQVFYKYMKTGLNEIGGVIGVSIHHTNRVAYIKTLVADNYDEAKMILSMTIDIFRDKRFFNLKCLLSERVIDEHYKEFFEENGFVKEANLKNEHIYGDLLIYSYDLKDRNY